LQIFIIFENKKTKTMNVKFSAVIKVLFLAVIVTAAAIREAMFQTPQGGAIMTLTTAVLK
jgi:hypothetical protein